MQQWALIVISAVLFSGAYILTDKGNTGGGTLFVAPAVFALFLAFVDKFKLFKGFGFEAELWRERMEEADRLIKRLRALTITSFKPIAHLVADRGMMFSSELARSEMHNWIEVMEAQLKSYDVSGAETEEVLQPLYQRVEMEMSTVIADAIRACLFLTAGPLHVAIQNMPGPIEGENLRRIKELTEERTRLKALSDRMRSITAPEYAGRRAGILCDTIQSSTLLTSNQRQELADLLESRLEDLKYYEKHRSHRDAAIWLSRNWKAEREWAVASISPDLKYTHLSI